MKMITVYFFYLPFVYLVGAIDSIGNINSKFVYNKATNFDIFKSHEDVHYHEKDEEDNKVNGKYSSAEQEDLDNADDIKTLIEEKYRFRNDETSRRFKIQNNENNDDQHMDWAFRAYAVRRIVGGMETSITIYPYNVAISRSGSHWCGGSIIDEQWVLTAGHCFEVAYNGSFKKLESFIVRAGSSFHNRGGYQARINKVFFPTSYQPGSADFDFSLLRLDRPLPIGRNIAVLNLPFKEYVIEENDIIIVSGWGSTDPSGYGNIPDRLRFVPVPVMQLSSCQKSYRFYITPRMMCAGYSTGGKDACNHDSGGPAVRDGVLLGVVSFGGKQCGDPNAPGVYARVSEITDWVEKTIMNNEAQSDPELWPKIKKAHEREGKLQKFKARIEEKKKTIKKWLRDTLTSTKFIELAKAKLREVGFHARRASNSDTDASSLDDDTIDDINLSNSINDMIVEDGKNDDYEILIRALAMHQVIETEPDEINVLRNRNDNSSVRTLVVLITRLFNI